MSHNTLRDEITEIIDTKHYSHFYIITSNKPKHVEEEIETLDEKRKLICQILLKNNNLKLPSNNEHYLEKFCEMDLPWHLLEDSHTQIQMITGFKESYYSKYKLEELTDIKVYLLILLNITENNLELTDDFVEHYEKINDSKSDLYIHLLQKGLGISNYVNIKGNLRAFLKFNQVKPFKLPRDVKQMMTPKEMESLVAYIGPRLNKERINTSENPRYDINPISFTGNQILDNVSKTFESMETKYSEKPNMITLDQYETTFTDLMRQMKQNSGNISFDNELIRPPEITIDEFLDRKNQSYSDFIKRSKTFNEYTLDQKVRFVEKIKHEFDDRTIFKIITFSTNDEFLDYVWDIFGDDFIRKQFVNNCKFIIDDFFLKKLNEKIPDTRRIIFISLVINKKLNSVRTILPDISEDEIVALVEKELNK